MERFVSGACVMQSNHVVCCYFLSTNHRALHTSSCLSPFVVYRFLPFSRSSHVKVIWCIDINVTVCWLSINRYTTARPCLHLNFRPPCCRRRHLGLRIKPLQVWQVPALLIDFSVRSSTIRNECQISCRWSFLKLITVHHWRSSVAVSGVWSF